MDSKKVVAVSCEESKLYGCPYCGFLSIGLARDMDLVVMSCDECHETYVVLGRNLKKSTIGIVGKGGEGIYYPELQDHPRRGTLAHGRPDKKPEGGGEFFHSRGIGMDTTPGCFICGGKEKLRSNIAAFVQCKEAGERVVAMFGRGAWLDYRESEPTWIQVKVGACEKHLTNLVILHNETLIADEVITEEMIDRARQ